jgi:uncharacterized membrane protein
MITTIKILIACTLVGALLATVFMTPGGALAGGLKGLLLGMVIAWGEWKSTHTVRVVSYAKPSRR